MTLNQALPNMFTNDATIVLLLCGRFGETAHTDPKPRTAGEYDAFARWLLENGLLPADLLEGGDLGDLQNAGKKLDPTRIQKLLRRGGALGLALESWNNKGL